MNGVRHIRILRIGRKLNSLIIIILAFTLFLNACSYNRQLQSELSEFFFGDGRGDWSFELCSGYSIIKTNSKGVTLGYKEKPDDSGWSHVISNNYFITSYQMYEPYIILEGIQHKDIFISEDELSNAILSYYFVDTTSGEVKGPFESYDDLAEYCCSVELELGEWIKIDSNSSRPPSE